MSSHAESSYSWLMTNRTHGHANINVVTLAPPPTLTHTAMAVHSIAFVEHYSPAWLFYHRNVHVFDLIVAHTLMESIGIFTSFVVIMSVLTLFGVVDPVRDPGLSLAAWRLDTLWCFFALIARESWGRAWRAS
jgi:ABC-type polysaccharide/polyol phosphate export permease